MTNKSAPRRTRTAAKAAEEETEPESSGSLVFILTVCSSADVRETYAARAEIWREQAELNIALGQVTEDVPLIASLYEALSSETSDEFAAQLTALRDLVTSILQRMGRE